MRTLKKVLFFLVFAGLFVGCNKDEAFIRETPEVDLKSGAAKVAVFMVQPSGGDDTPAIMQAFNDAKAAGPGSVVQLVEGEYHLGFLEIRDFYGALKGAGKGKTIITAHSIINMSPIWAKNLFPDLVKFVGGNVMISHLSIQTPSGIITTGGPGRGHIASLFSFAMGNATYELLNENRSINAVIDHVSFKGNFLAGGIGFFYNTYNCFYAVRAGYDIRTAPANSVPRNKVNIKITNSDFDTFSYGVVLVALKNSMVVIGENNKGNVFNNLEKAAGIWDSRAVNMQLEGNTFNIPELCWGFDHSDYPSYPILKNEAETEASICNIQNNVFNLTNADYGIYLRNQRHYLNPGETPVAFQIRNNQFNMTDGNPWGIYSEITKGAVIRNNQFKGYGYQALGLVLNSQGGLVLGNNFSTAQFSSAAIYLNPTTRDWSVVGGNLKDKVINLGENNVIAGMNVSTSDEPLGRAISQKLVPMNHLLN